VSRVPVLKTPEFHRIDELPRRKLEELDGEALAKEWTEALKNPWGTMKLRPVQALALREMAIAGGLFGPMGVGSGKSLVSFLAPTVLEAKRPVLLVPASLVEKTGRDLRALSEHWMLESNIRVRSYESLSVVSGADLLEKRDVPDLLILDEAHKIRNKTAGVTKRVARYLHGHPECRVVAISGTMVKSSIEDFAHIIDWVLKERSPVPRIQGDLMAWIAALDADVNPFDMVPPGAILAWSSPEEIEAEGVVRAARLAFQRRLIETEGVVATRDESVGASLNVRGIAYQVSPTTEHHFKTLRELAETPDGKRIEEQALVWALTGQLALGMHYAMVDRDKLMEWDGRHEYLAAVEGEGLMPIKGMTPELVAFISSARPPDAWINARREWNGFVQDNLHGRLDTPLQVELACREGVLDDRLLKNWKGIEPLFTPLSIDVWHDQSALDLCEKWAKKKPGIVWVKHRLFGAELARRTGLRYFVNDGLDAAGNFIDDETGKHAIIASIDSNSTGRNLQQFHRNLFTVCGGAALMEQAIGRTHRSGQASDEVEVDILIGCREAHGSFHKALAGARMANETQGASQKLLSATVDMPTLAELRAAGGGVHRWAKGASVSSDD
jgi:hypothetical protein